jgi:hypothetical protein
LIYADHLPYLTVYMSHTTGVLWEAGTAYHLRVPEFIHGFFGGSVLLIFLVFVLTYNVSLYSEFRVVMSFTISAYKLSYVRLYLQLLVGGLMSYLRYLCLFVCSGMQDILCCVFVCFSSSCVPFVDSLSLVTDRTRLEVISEWTHDHPMKTPLAKSVKISSFFFNIKYILYWPSLFFL